MKKITGLENLKNSLTNLPTSAGVYRMIGQNNKILYVGKAKNIKKRVTSYTKFNKLPNRLKQMVSEIKKVEIVKTDSEIEALILELNFIKTLKPAYNIMLKDDKTYPYIYFNAEHDYPGIYKYRGERTKKGTYFGPYVGGYDVNKTIDLLKKSFLLRSCSNHDFNNRDKPCLEYQIKRCSAPCVNYIDKSDYAKLLAESYDFLNGKTAEVREQLSKKMEQASTRMDYERAAELRDRIKAISTITAKQDISDHSLNDSDIYVVLSEDSTVIIEQFIFRNGFNHGNQHFFPKNTDGLSDSEILTEFIKQYYGPHNLVKEIICNCKIENHTKLAEAFAKQYGKKTKFITPKTGRKNKILDFVLQNAKYHLEQKLNSKNRNLKYHTKLQKILALPDIPQKIEVFDNSHISGTSAVGAMIASDLHGFDKNNYRKFNIKSANSGDDYDMLREVLFRRYSRLINEDPDNQNKSWPDLILIDGGKGQATIAAEIFSELKLTIPFFCIAKGEFRNKGQERFCNNFTDYFKVEEQDVLYYLQRIRDEAHRFVIETHRKKRAKTVTKSELDNIPGIGPRKKQELLKYFGSVAKIKAASVEDLAKVPGINLKLAEMLLDLLQ